MIVIKQDHRKYVSFGCSKASNMSDEGRTLLQLHTRM